MFKAQIRKIKYKKKKIKKLDDLWNKFDGENK